MIAPVSTYLFVPADRPDRVEKALVSDAGAVVVDLEDAVGAGNKDAARAALGEMLLRRRDFVVRINAAGTEWHADDLASLSGCAPAAIMVPKAETVGELAVLAAWFPESILLPLIETARGLDAASDIARAANVQRLVFGSIDFQLDLGISGDGDELLFARSQLVLASRLAGISRPVDGVSLSIEGDGLVAEARRARSLGFGGKLCIHPRQLEPVAAAFRPTRAEYEHAQRVVAAAAASDGAVRLDGQMVDRPVVELARHIIATIESAQAA